MKIGFKEVCINPLKPVKQAGFIQQVDDIFTFHDDLYARILGLADNKREIYLCVLDNLGVSEGLTLQQELIEKYRKYTGKQIIVQISCTHDHFAGYAGDKTYYKQLFNTLWNAIKSFEFTQTRLYISHKHVFFDEVGKSRISHHETPNIFLDLFELSDKEKRLGTLIVYNCHPTILSGDTPYFSSEYPGYVIQKLKEFYPDEFFMFFQGAAGDISTRFTRSSQDYAGVEQLGNKLVWEVMRLLKQSAGKNEIENMQFENHIFRLEYTNKPVDLSNLPDDLTERELETIEIGKKVRAKYIATKKQLEPEINISKLALGGYNLIFSPKETFSSYISALNTNKSVLICYTNGYSPYIVDIGFKGVTYEMFTDLTNEDTKIRMYKLLENLGR